MYVCEILIHFLQFQFKLFKNSVIKKKKRLNDYKVKHRTLLAFLSISSPQKTKEKKMKKLKEKKETFRTSATNLYEQWIK